MKRHIEYFKYVILHKWFVFLACLKLNVSFWQSITHDLSKFSKSEWNLYANTFFNEDGTRVDLRKNGAYDPNNTGEVTGFTYAWIHHQKNPHHWQAWISIGDYGNLKAAKIPEKYIREMLADWSGAGMAITGNPNPTEWYEKNKEKMILHPETRAILVELLRVYYG